MATSQAHASQSAKPYTPITPESTEAMASGSDGTQWAALPQNAEPQANSPNESRNGSREPSPTSDGPSRKRRRSRKGLSKKYECQEPDCNKSYSRAEHLYRHQLNHNAKHTFRCDFPNCTRTFVRQDLLKRHKDRHTNKGSQLSRKDSVISHVAHSTTTERAPQDNPFEHTAFMPDVSQQFGQNYASPHDGSPAHFNSASPVATAVYGNVISPAAAANGYEHHMGRYPQTPPARMQQVDSGMTQPRPRSGSYGMQPSMPPQHSQQPPHVHSRRTNEFVPQQNVVPMDLPPAQYPQFQTVGNRAVKQEAYQEEPEQQTHNDEFVMLDQMSASGTMPVFGTDATDGVMNRSPYVGMPSDFLHYLFSTGSDVNAAQGSPIGSPILPSYSNYGDLGTFSYGTTDQSAFGYFPSGTQQIMAVNNLLEQTVPENTISEEKSQEIFDYISDNFKEKDQAPAERQRANILEGDRSDPEHVLCTRMMKAYISSYWYHFSDQMPILHRPTFSPEKTPTLLLLAMMTIGAACLDRTHGAQVTKRGAQLANFLAWHLRWEVFMSSSAQPPAKLWAFQTLILLELYEKMYSTRELHERAHIHHATTVTLMRRGRALMGRLAADSPPEPRESANGSRQSSTLGASRTPQEWWDEWIANEATRRVAFAAFAIDSIHASMFGHNAFMVAHEMRLPMPCDESLWRATSSAEVGRLEANLMSQGNKSKSFLDCLKRTLKGENVQASPFGRTIIMAGLLSVTWHLSQRDLQLSSLGDAKDAKSFSAMGGRDTGWRKHLTQAFDNWKSDFDAALDRNDASTEPYRYDRKEFNVVFESRIVLHHLAHMSMHSDIILVQVYARAKRLLGRTIGSAELRVAQRKIKRWATTALARDAVFYAVQFLSSVLMPDSADYGPAGRLSPPERYEAREDVLLNRAWVLYFAALVVWSYGYALEGPCADMIPPATSEEKEYQMRDYLLRFRSLRDPSELAGMVGLNRNTALLMVLKDSFETTRWQLLQEGSNLLNNCIILNTTIEA